MFKKVNYNWKQNQVLFLLCVLVETRNFKFKIDGLLIEKERESNACERVVQIESLTLTVNWNFDHRYFFLDYFAVSFFITPRSNIKSLLSHESARIGLFVFSDCLLSAVELSNFNHLFSKNGLFLALIWQKLAF